MMPYILLVTVLHFSDSGQVKSLNVETLQFNTNNCESLEKSMREHYRNERSSRLVNINCLKVN